MPLSIASINAEIGDNPRKQNAFLEFLPVRYLLTIAGAAEEERRCRQIVDGFDAEFRLHCFKSAYPQSRAVVIGCLSILF